MNKTKKQIGAKLIHKTGRIGTVIEVNENSLTLEFDDGSTKIYSFSTINSKFSLLDESKCSINDVQCSKSNNEQNELEELKKTVKALTKLVNNLNQKLEKLENDRAEELEILKSLNQRLEKLESDRAEEYKTLENLKHELEKSENNKIEEYESLKAENESLKKESEQLKNNTVQEQNLNVKEKIKIGRPIIYKDDVARKIQELKLEGKTYREISSMLGCSIGYISSKLKSL